jgi:hypothetical protein
MVRVIVPMYDISLFEIVTMNLPCVVNISIKKDQKENKARG